MLRLSTEDCKDSFVYKWLADLRRTVSDASDAGFGTGLVCWENGSLSLTATDRSGLGRSQGFSKMTWRGKKGRLRFFKRLRNPKMLRVEILYLSTQAPSGVTWCDFCALSVQSWPDFFMIHELLLALLLPFPVLSVRGRAQSSGDT